MRKDPDQVGYEKYCYFHHLISGHWGKGSFLLELEIVEERIFVRKKIHFKNVTNTYGNCVLFTNLNQKFHIENNANLCQLFEYMSVGRSPSFVFNNNLEKAAQDPQLC